MYDAQSDLEHNVALLSSMPDLKSYSSVQFFSIISSPKQVGIYALR